MYDLIIKNGIIVTEKNQLKGTLAVQNGVIAAILSPDICVEAKQTIDANGKYILPGIVDPHVHAGHGNPERETFYNASVAAAAGGITTMLEQPLSNPSTVTLEAFNNKCDEASKNCVIDFGLWGGLVPEHLDDMIDIFNAGGHAFKSFMCRCSNYPMTDDGSLLKGMRKLGELGALSAVHAENDTLIQQLVDDFKAEGKNDADAFLNSHPIYSELEAIQRYIFIARQAPKCKSHLVHVSVPEGIIAVKKAQLDGVDITAETCPQYLALCEDDLRSLGGIAKCDPPVRPIASVNALWELVLNGTVDMIASDHSPHPFERKVVSKDNFPYASEGVTGLQTMVPVLLTDGVHKRGMSLNRLVELCCGNTARRFGLYPQKGSLDIGSDADFIILDLEKEWVCKAENMHYLNKHTPFDGRVFKGYIEKTFVRGTTVYDNGKLTVEPGFGNFIKMNMKN